VTQDSGLSTQHSAAAGVIFDLDGVLIDSEALQYKAYSQVLQRFGVSVSVEEYGTYWIAAGRGPEHAVETYGLPVEPDALRALKDPVYHEILRREVTLMPGAIEALARMQPRFPIALATNSNRQDAGFVLEHFDLRRFFTAVVTREDYTLAKPHPDAFLTAAARLGRAARQCVVVEDAYKGIVAASRAGSVPVAVPNRFTRGNDFSLATRVMDSLDDLTVEVVERLLGQPARA
jgi:HAD superfamily hydrolase (TIGR01509 family)